MHLRLSVGILSLLLWTVPTAAQCSDDYTTARDFFKAGQYERAIQALTEIAPEAATRNVENSSLEAKVKVFIEKLR